MSNGENPDPGFGAKDNDGRVAGHWETRYVLEAQKHILREAQYLGALLFLLPLIALGLWCRLPQYLANIPEYQYASILKYGFAWFSGSLGGTLFAIKYLYHSVAKYNWNLDRRLWRIFTPHISGALAFVTLALVSSRILQVFDRETLNSFPFVIGFGFLVGYFSDNAIAKLAQLAGKLFNTSKE